YNLGLNFRKSGVTRKGAESFTAVQFGKDPVFRSELFLPFDARQISFFKPYFQFGQKSFNHVVNNHIESRYNIEKLIFGAALGLEFSNLGIFSVGAEEQRGNIETYIGPDSETFHFKDIVHYFLFEYDSLDNLNFPGAGSLIRLRYDKIRPKQRMVEDFAVTSSYLLKGFNIGRNKFIFKGEMIRSIHQISGRHFQQSLGGLLRLSGPHDDSLVGNSSLYTSVTWLRRLTRQSILPVDFPVYGGIALEAGNVWDRTADMSSHDLLYGATLLLAVDSPLGPVYLGYGRTENEFSAYYIKLGRIF
ncbi:MAG: hypothetical protein OEZ23_02570, partial [Gammaproteobacteria bacterium]|nr:hypothetical protein [Gammaproteobacteria bacterium]